MVNIWIHVTIFLFLLVVIHWYIPKRWRNQPIRRGSETPYQPIRRGSETPCFFYIRDTNETYKRWNYRKHGSYNKNFPTFALEYLKRHPWRVLDRNKANIVFVPNYESCPGGSTCYKKRHHLRTPNETSFTVYQKPDRFYRNSQNTFDGFKTTPEKFSRSQKWLTLPWMTTTSIKPLAAPNFVKKKYLVSGIFKIHGSSLSKRIRTSFKENCLVRANCYYSNHIVNYDVIYKQSTFVFCPPGDSWTRKATFDALANNAIPVIFSTKSLNYPLHLQNPYGNITVLLKPTDNVIDKLLNIQPSQIQRMRQNIANLYPKLFFIDPRYLKMPHKLDAMETILLHLCQQ